MVTPAEKAKDVVHAVEHPVETAKSLEREADEGRSPRTPLIALTGVTLFVGVIFVIVVTIAAYVKRRMPKEVWLWLHRVAYLAFGLVFVHAVLSGTDFSDPAVSAITWGSAAALLTLAVARVLGGRLPA